MPTPAQIQQAQLFRSMGLTPEHLRSITRLQLTEEQRAPQLIERGDGGQAEYGPATTYYDVNFPQGDLQSKFNSVRQNEDGSFTARFQQPGRHKYDTFEGTYDRDAATNQLTLRPGSLGATREIGRGERFRDAMETGGAFVGSNALMAYGGAQMLGLAGAGASTGGQLLGSAARAAAVSGATAAAAGADTSQVQRAALMGAVTGAAGTGARLATGLTGAAGQAVSSAASAATSSAIRGSDTQTTLRNAVIGALPGLAGVALNDNQALSPTTAQLVRELGRAAVSGQAPANRQALLVQFLAGIARQAGTQNRGT